MQPQLSLEHMDGLQRAFAAAPAETQRELEGVMQMVTGLMEGELQADRFPRSVQRPMHPKAKRTPRHRIHTAQTITSDVLSMKPAGVLGILGSDSPIALYVEDGTEPHEIRARHAKALAWPLGFEIGAGFGGPVKAVKHPGTKPQKVFERYSVESIPMVVREVERAIERLVVRLFGPDAIGGAA